jgi:hypothetical protein
MLGSCSRVWQSCACLAFGALMRVDEAGAPVARDHRGDDRVGFDTVDQRGHRGPVLGQVLARARPARHHGHHQVGGTDPVAEQVGRWLVADEAVGERAPHLVQAAARARAQALVGVLVRLAEPALGVVDDADGRVAVGGHVDQRAQGHRALHRVGRQQARARVREAEVDQAGRAFAEHRALGRDQRRDLVQRVDALQRGEGLGLVAALVPGGGVDDAVRRLGELERGLDHGRARIAAAVERVGPLRAHISMVLRIRPTARPSISKVSPSDRRTMIGSKSGFSGSSSM